MNSDYKFNNIKTKCYYEIEEFLNGIDIDIIKGEYLNGESYLALQYRDNLIKFEFFKDREELIQHFINMKLQDLIIDFVEKGVSEKGFINFFDLRL